MPAAAARAAFVEAVECYGAAVPHVEARRRLLAALARLWGVPGDEVERYLTLAKPTIQVPLMPSSCAPCAAHRFCA